MTEIVAANPTGFPIQYMVITPDLRCWVYDSAGWHLAEELRGPMVKTSDFESENSGSSPDEAANRCAQYLQGRREAIKWAVTWLHCWANEMNDPHAKDILNCAAFNMGVDAKGPLKRMKP